MFEVVMKGGLDGPTGTLLDSTMLFFFTAHCFKYNNEMLKSSDFIGKALGYFSWEKANQKYLTKTCW